MKRFRINNQTFIFIFPAVGSDICWMFWVFKRVNCVTQVPLLWPPFSFEWPSLPHGAAPAADLLTPQRSAHPSLSSWQPGRRAATYLPPSERTSQVKNWRWKENDWMMKTDQTIQNDWKSIDAVNSTSDWMSENVGKICNVLRFSIAGSSYVMQLRGHSMTRMPSTVSWSCGEWITLDLCPAPEGCLNWLVSTLFTPLLSAMLLGCRHSFRALYLVNFL